jgi:uncharacterized protein (TIGR04255 family)
MRIQYDNPPLREAVCQIRFDPKGPWDSTIPGLLYEQLSSRFPVRKEETEVPLLLSSRGKVGPTRIRFYEKDEGAAVQLGSHFIAVNQLPPYPSWESFLPKIEAAVSAYAKVAEPVGVTFAELRYINFIPLETEPVELSTVFNMYPSFAEDFPSEYVSFIVGGQFLCNNEDALLTVSLQTDQEVETFGAKLDLSYRPLRPIDLTLEDLSGWLDVAHMQIEKAFQSALREEVKETFNARQEPT